MICEQDDTTARLTVRCRAQSGATAVLPVLDISAGGFMVPYEGWDAAPGERVLATIAGFSVRPAELVWVEDGLAGIAFAEPLHAAVFDQMRSKLEGTFVDAAALALQREQEEAAAAAPRRRLLG